jgi:hypothetical protein
MARFLFESAALVSDYVAGRLDAAGHKRVADALREDPQLAKAVADAEELRQRVHGRWTQRASNPLSLNFS